MIVVMVGLSRERVEEWRSGGVEEWRSGGVGFRLPSWEGLGVG